MLSVVTSGLPISAKDILSNAIGLAFGAGVADLVELNRDNLRSNIRMSSRNIQVVLVVLDGVSSDLCKDIEGGLYSTDKYHCYTDDTSLVKFLNMKYKLNLELPNEPLIEESEDRKYSESTLSEITDRYEAQLQDRNMMIESLEARIAELNDLIESEDYQVGISKENYNNIVQELDIYKKENLGLRDSILNFEKCSLSKEEEISELKNEREELKNSLEKLEKSKNSLLSEYRSVSDELTKLKVENSRQSGLINLKNQEIERLQNRVCDIEELESSIVSLNEDIKNKDKNISSIYSEISNLNEKISSKDRDIERLKEEIKQNGITSDLVDSLKSDIVKLEEDKSKLNNTISSNKEKYSELQNNFNLCNEDKGKLELELSELQERIKEYDNNLSILNTEKLRLEGQIRVLEQSSERNLDIESMSLEIIELRRKYDNLSKNIFSKIGNYAMPKSSTNIHLTRGNVNLKNIKFVFSGSTESRKGTYRCLLNEFKKIKNKRIVLVDVVSETSVDYVFEIQTVVNGLEWFRRGGGLQPYLSKTCLNNVSVLSPGLGYVNDSYLLMIDWENRLSELEKSGYVVIVYCGDISNIVGRVFHESFAGLGNSSIYVHGNAVGSRTIISNLMGISNFKDSDVVYFDFNKNMERFYKIVSKTNKCNIIW